jgi:rubrerythrin
MNRRSFLKGTAAVIPAGIALQMLGERWAWAGAPAFAQDFSSDLEVLNYALTLEYLEAAFYKQGNMRVQLMGREAQFLQAIGADEQAHVDALTATILKMGGSPVAAPGVDFGDAFKDREHYLKLSHTFENTGVQAYLGAAGSIKNKDVLQAAAGLYGVEARHAAVVGHLLGLKADDGVFMGPMEKPKSKSAVLAAVKPFIK